MDNDKEIEKIELGIQSTYIGINKLMILLLIEGVLRVIGYSSGAIHNDLLGISLDMATAVSITGLIVLSSTLKELKAMHLELSNKGHKIV